MYFCTEVGFTSSYPESTPRNMGLEIERKFLVTDGSYVEAAGRAVEMAQGYLSRVPERTVRVRICGEKGYLTIKGRNNGFVREEFEYEIPVTDAERLLTLCEGRVIRKRRYYVEFEGHTWEVDCFHGDLSPLVTAEIELSSEFEKVSLPPFIGQEVTGNPAYYNSNL